MQTKLHWQPISGRLKIQDKSEVLHMETGEKFGGDEYVNCLDCTNGFLPDTLCVKTYQTAHFKCMYCMLIYLRKF